MASKFFAKIASKTEALVSSIGPDKKESERSRSDSKSDSSKSASTSSSSSTSSASESKAPAKKKTKPPQQLEVGEVGATATYIPAPKGPKSSAHSKGQDVVQHAKKTRMGKGLSDLEEFQIRKLAKVFEDLYGAGSAPVQFKTEVKTEVLFKYTQGYTPDEKAMHQAKWYRDIADANGKFTKEAKEIVNIICNYQLNKSKKIGVAFHGYPDDPENCFCDEFKEWTVQKFAKLELEEAKDIIKKRINYLDDILCKEDLFDRPGSGDLNTVQKSFLKVRHVLKATVQALDAAVMDIGTSLDQIINLVSNLLDDSASLLWYSFREKPMKEDEDFDEDGPTDKAADIHKSVLANPAFKVVFANRLKPGCPPLGTLVKHSVVKYGDNGKLHLHEMYIPLAPGQAPPSNLQLAELSNLQYTKIFAGENSGFDRSFRSNEPAAKLYLEGHAILVELATVWGVLKQAKKCHQSLTTHLAANAHFRDIIELTDRLAGSLRSTLYRIVEIGEARFEQLVDVNWATVLRCPWIGNFRVIPKLFVNIEHLVADVYKADSVALGKASVPIKQPKADDKAEHFVAAAEELTRNIGKSLGFAFGAQKLLQEGTGKPKIDLAPIAVKEEQASATDKIFSFLSNPAAAISGEATEEKVEEKKPKGFKQYTLDLITADKLGAGTDANVYCALVGTKARTGKIELGEDEDKSRFEQGQVDTFTIDVEADIGEVKELVLGHDNKGTGSDWNVKEARLADLSTQNVLNFTCDTTIGGGFSKKCEASFFPDKH